jgi:hypothetical protein
MSPSEIAICLCFCTALTFWPHDHQAVKRALKKGLTLQIGSRQDIPVNRSALNYAQGWFTRGQFDDLQLRTVLTGQV